MTEALAAFAPYLATASLALLAGAGLGYHTRVMDERRARRPRYRRVGSPE